MKFDNPFRPGAGHMPVYLAGREDEKQKFRRLLDQKRILQNMILTGRRGVGKTVLLETLKPLAYEANWLWVGTDLSEAASLTDEAIALRLLTDLAVVGSSIIIGVSEAREAGFTAGAKPKTLNFETLSEIYDNTPGLVADKLKTVLEVVWKSLRSLNKSGIIFAYDEAQVLSDHSDEKEYPLSLLLDVFQSIQRKDIPFMLVLTGLPNLFAKLAEARTFAERMFQLIQIDRLDKDASLEAINEPIHRMENPPTTFSEALADTIAERSGGYPYFIQFICREVFDVALQKLELRQKPLVPLNEIIRKLDTDFFAGRDTDRKRELLVEVTHLATCDDEFTILEIVELAKNKRNSTFSSSSYVNQLLSQLCEAGLVFKVRHGKYSLGVPLLSDFVGRWSQRN
jgi:hypothetical protein